MKSKQFTRTLNRYLSLHLATLLSFLGTFSDLNAATLAIDSRLIVSEASEVTVPGCSDLVLERAIRAGVGVTPIDRIVVESAGEASQYVSMVWLGNDETLTTRAVSRLLVSNASVSAIVSLMEYFDDLGPAVQLQASPFKPMVPIVPISCDFPEQWPVVADAVREVLGQPSIPLTPYYDLVADLGLAEDQVTEIISLAESRLDVVMEEDALTRLDEIVVVLSRARAASAGARDNSDLAERERVQWVYYATTRQRVEGDDGGVDFGGSRDLIRPMHFGKAQISIPIHHEKGEIESPFFLHRLLVNEEDHVVIQALNPMTRENFIAGLAPHEEAQGWAESLIVYIHGYNVSFATALKRAGQLAYDFEFPGATLLFSWPSDGALTQYASDREDATWSSFHLARLLRILKDEYPDRPVHLIAHSMGSQVLVGAIHQLSLQSNDENERVAWFDQVILAAPDFDTELFQYQIAPDVIRMANQWTIYTSNKDSALQVSSSVNQVKRLGQPVPLIEEIKVIDASGLSTNPWSIPSAHSYYATSEVVIDDIVAILKKGRHKRVRHDLNGYYYWKLQENETEGE